MGGVEEDSLFFSLFEVFEVSSFSSLFSESWKFVSFSCLSSTEVFSLRGLVSKGDGWEQFPSSGFVFKVGQSSIFLMSW